MYVMTPPLPAYTAHCHCSRRPLSLQLNLGNLSQQYTHTHTASYTAEHCAHHHAFNEVPHCAQTAVVAVEAVEEAVQQPLERVIVLKLPVLAHITA
jgi:hypothetical protein